MIAATFEPADYGPAAAALLAPRRIAEVGPGAPNEAARQPLEALSAGRLFGERRIVNPEMAAACLSGLWLYHDFLDESHRLSQDIATPTGSFWHGIMHRREGDFSNAKYWFRQVGDHPVYSPLREAAVQLSGDALPDATHGVLAPSPNWDPCLFVDLCQQAQGDNTPLNSLCRWIQLREWELLFDYCFRYAVEPA